MAGLTKCKTTSAPWHYFAWLKTTAIVFYEITTSLQYQSSNRCSQNVSITDNTQYDTRYSWDADALNIWHTVTYCILCITARLTTYTNWLYRYTNTWKMTAMLFERTTLRIIMIIQNTQKKTCIILTHKIDKSWTHASYCVSGLIDFSQKSSIPSIQLHKMMIQTLFHTL